MAQRIKEFAKNLNLDIKEALEITEQAGVGAKTQNSTLKEEDIAKIINYLTLERQISSMDDYLNGKIVIPSKKKPAKKTQGAKKDREKEQAAQTTAEKTNADEKISPAKEMPENKEIKEKTDNETEVKAPITEEIKAEPSEKTVNATSKPGIRTASDVNARAKSVSEQDGGGKSRQTYSHDTTGSDGKSREEAAQSNAVRDAAKSGTWQQRPASDQQRSGGTWQQRPASNQQGSGGTWQQRPASNQQGSGGTWQQRPASNQQGSGGYPRTNGFNRNDNRGASGNQNNSFGSFSNDKRPQYNPLPKHKIPQSTTVEIKKKTGTKRVVDTRTVNVDLSKYDEKTESYASSYDNYGSSKQKLKKQNTRDAYSSKKEKERMAMERIKKEVFEKAKKTQLSITVPDEITVGELASRLKVVSGEIIKKLVKMGVMATVNEVIDYDTAYLIADELGAKVTKEIVVTIEEKLFDEEDASEDLVLRAPVVCVMGHVDHGKTSLLDAIRHTSVISGEAGGITQHIGAYRVEIGGKEITFLDTPGHEAFTAMRLRGAMATDIAIIVVAADDGIMPQTIEAINHAKAAGVDIIVAINKMDKPEANPDNIKQELTKYDLVPEEWGGDVICVPVSAHTKEGIDELLENILLISEVKELKANPKRQAKGIVIEAKLDKGRGPVATILVQNGTLKSGDVVIAGSAVGRVRAMTDHKGEVLKEAGPSVPVEIIGLDEVPFAGDEFNAVRDERMARELASQRREKAKENEFKASSKINLDDLFAQISDGAKEINVIIKADVGGSCEAVKSSLEKLSNGDVKLRVIHTAVGGITESDVMLAAASNAVIIGFNVRPDKNAIDSAARQNVDIRTHRIIYEIIEEMETAMKGMLSPEFKEVINGHAEVRQTIKIPNGTIAGSYVKDGKITRSSQIRIIRDGIVISEDKISSLRRFKDDTKEVSAGYECGIGLEKFNDIKEGDILESFIMEEIAR